MLGAIGIVAALGIFILEIIGGFGITLAFGILYILFIYNKLGIIGAFGIFVVF